MKSSFQNLVDQEVLILIDFYADWCGPCQTLAPILKEVKSEMGDEIKILKVDVDRNQLLAGQFAIRGVPTLILFKNGKQVWKTSGVMTKADLVQQIRSHQ